MTLFDANKKRTFPGRASLCRLTRDIGLFEPTPEWPEPRAVTTQLLLPLKEGMDGKTLLSSEAAYDDDDDDVPPFDANKKGWLRRP